SGFVDAVLHVVGIVLVLADRARLLGGVRRIDLTGPVADRTRRFLVIRCGELLFDAVGLIGLDGLVGRVRLSHGCSLALMSRAGRMRSPSSEAGFSRWRF